MVICQLLPHMLPIFITWFSEYITVQAVITTLAFPSSPFKPRDHYEYYIVVFMVGEMVGRSYLLVLSYIKKDWGEKAKFPYLWVLCLVFCFWCWLPGTVFYRVYGSFCSLCLSAA